MRVRATTTKRGNKTYQYALWVLIYYFRKSSREA
jgi:hypothetical protein